MNKFITAKFSSNCSQTGKPIKKGDNILYDTQTKKVYCSQSKTYQNEVECQSTTAFVQANEDALYDNFCMNNGI